MIAAYIEELRQQLILCEQVVSFKIVRELLGNRDAFIRVKCSLEGGDILEFAEYVQAGAPGRIVRETYSYHWQTKAGKLIKRWDNAPHHREIATFPDHLHDGDMVRESRAMTLAKVLREISRRKI